MADTIILAASKIVKLKTRVFGNGEAMPRCDHLLLAGLTDPRMVMLVQYADDGFAVAARRAVAAAPAARKALPMRLFVPAQDEGGYKLPQEAQERLRTALATSRNREAAYRLAAFLGRFWSASARLLMAFPIDRRALADHQHLDLTESEIRGAIAALERVGYLDRDQGPRGSRYRATGEGLRRKPILYRFAREYGALFEAANHRAHRRSVTPSAPNGSRAPAHRLVLPPARGSNSPKDRNWSKTKVLMGEHIQPVSAKGPPNPALERALEALRMAIEGGAALDEARMVNIA